LTARRVAANVTAGESVIGEILAGILGEATLGRARPWRWPGRLLIAGAVALFLARILLGP
jgi:hypothetical protein